MGAMLCIYAGEITLGTFAERSCHFYWWDYSKIPLHWPNAALIFTALVLQKMMYSRSSYYVKILS